MSLTEIKIHKVINVYTGKETGEWDVSVRGGYFHRYPSEGRAESAAASLRRIEAHRRRNFAA